jgi:signal transduction histidine kinase/ActR/RegA family two-component response regulator
VISVEQRINILLVDDRVENLLALEAALSPLNQNLVRASSGKEALKALLEKDFAVILMDVKMPGMDGFETASLIRAREKSAHTPIIFITAQYKEDEHLNRGYSVGAVDYILKPFSPEVLRSKVAVFVDLAKKSDEIRRQSELIRQIEQREYEVRLADAHRRIEAENYRVRLERQIAQAVVEHAPVGIVRTDNNMVISEANQVFAELFQMQPRNLMRKPIFKALPWLPQPLIEAIQVGKQFSIEQYRIASNEDEDDDQRIERYLDLAVWPVMGHADTLAGTILMAQDVTERVALSQQREDFVATLAHDLQTPVIASDRALELLLSATSDKLDPESVKMIGMLKKNNESLLNMIQGLLDVYRYQEGAQSLYFDNVDLRPLVSNCVESLQALAAKQRITLTQSMSDDLCTVWADRTALRRVIMNLLDNAIKFSRPEGQVEISAFNGRAQHVTFQITDNGIGISPRDQAHLFKRYWHGNGHQKTYKPGCGLGLYLCKQIVEAHHGLIGCESEPDKPTVFYVSLPCGTAPESDVNAAGAEAFTS